ncbi:MAG: hypothetical protein RLZZ546_1875 [Bacteroidota bacterium]|jgi:hypothetical protein
MNKNNFIHLYKQLFFLLIVIMGCGKEENIDFAGSTCYGDLITFDFLLIKENSICYSWFGPTDLDLEIKQKDGKGEPINRIINVQDNCVSGLSPSTTYTVSIYYRCYKNNKFGRVLFKSADITLSEFTPIENLSISNPLNREPQLVFDKKPLADEYFVEVKSKSDIGRSSFWQKSNNIELSLPVGNNYEVSISPVYKNLKNFEIIGMPLKSDFYSGDPLLTFDLPTPALVSCLPIVCDTSNLGPDIAVQNVVKTLKYFDNESSSCEIYYYKINYNNEKDIEMYLTVIRDNNGKIKIYFKDDYCGETNAALLFDGKGNLSYTFKNSSHVSFDFYKSYFTLSATQDVFVYRKRII